MAKLFDAGKAKPMGDDEKYSRSVRIPQYEPSAKKPSVDECMNFDKYSKLIREINQSGLPYDDKKLLLYAASRHIVFNYSKIADYYAHSCPEMQKLMEKSALVIIDVNDAIANGYVKLSEKMKQLVDESIKREGKNEA